MSTQRKLVSFSMCHPVFVTVIAERPSEHEDWDITGIRNVSCDASARSVMEHMGDDDWQSFDMAVDKAKDVTP